MSKKELELLKIQQDNLSKKIAFLEQSINNESNNIVERLPRTSEYYLIDLSSAEEDFVISSFDYYTDIHNNAYESSNYFYTEEEAKKFAEHIVLSLKILRARNKANNSCEHDWLKDTMYVVLLLEDEVVTVMVNTNFCKDILRFKSEKAKNAFLDSVSKEEIIKYLSF